MYLLGTIISFEIIAPLGSFYTGGSKCIILKCANLAQEWFSMWNQNRSSEGFKLQSHISLKYFALMFALPSELQILQLQRLSLAEDVTTEKMQGQIHIYIHTGEMTACPLNEYCTNSNRWPRFFVSLYCFVLFYFIYRKKYEGLKLVTPVVQLYAAYLTFSECVRAQELACKG